MIRKALVVESVNEMKQCCCFMDNFRKADTWRPIAAYLSQYVGIIGRENIMEGVSFRKEKICRRVLLVNNFEFT